MKSGFFYFIKDEFYESLPDCGLMYNKDGEMRKRPCCYCFKWKDYFWMIPISSRVEKYEKIYNHKLEKRGYCDTILFGYVNGRRSAFLIQNAFPVTEKYIQEQYLVENGTVPVSVNKKTAAALNAKVRKVVRLYEKGITITLTNFDAIIDYLTR